jgi:carbonic anhydrase/acetyltransferase-like protein (isoleucine patch superfamily)
MIIEYKGKKPAIGRDVFIAPTAVIIGDVTIGDKASIWYGAVIRGDMEPIRIGRETNIQDNCVVHTDWGKPVVIGNKVTVGHQAVVHGCTIEDNCLIGISASVLNGAVVKTGSVVAAGSVVREGQTVGPYHLMTGVPAEMKKDLGEGIVAVLDEPADIYVNLAREHIGLFPADG